MAEPSTTERTVCYRHPRVETGLSCVTCERPICTDCLVQGPVGHRCPECAGVPTGARKQVRRVSRAGERAPTGIVTYTLIALNAVVFMAQLITAGDISGTIGRGLRERRPLRAARRRRRMVAADHGAFLHGGLLHLAFNMLFLWWFGRNLEAFVGPARYLGIYIVSALAGSAGALLVAPDVPTVGASGAVFGILGAGLVLERGKGIAIFGGQALFVIVINLALGFVLSQRLDRRPYRRPHRRRALHARPRALRAPAPAPLARGRSRASRRSSRSAS